MFSRVRLALAAGALAGALSGVEAVTNANKNLLQAEEAEDNPGRGHWSTLSHRVNHKSVGGERNADIDADGTVQLLQKAER